VELHGRTILEHALHGVFGATHAAQVIVVAPASRLAQARSIAERVAGPASGHLAVVAGGDSRQASVAAGPEVVGEAAEAVAVRDAAGAVAPSVLIAGVASDVLAGAADGPTPALPVVDSVKRVEGERVVSGADR